MPTIKFAPGQEPPTLLPAFIIHRPGDVWRIAQVGADCTSGPGEREALRQSGLFSIIGPPARHLYVALAGHRFGTHPATASPMLARQSRAYIAEQSLTPALPVDHHYFVLAQEVYQMYFLSARVIRDFGEHIQPWLGAKAIDEEGKPVEFRPEYRLTVAL